ncbi:transcription initiation factor IIB, partial [archaeon]|nr:transcription initiation factor IIB [archaeon]
MAKKFALKKAQKTCPECDSTNVSLNRKTGELTCKNCGLVIEDNQIDFGQEWREFDYSQVKNSRRVGSPLTFTRHDMG